MSSKRLNREVTKIFPDKMSELSLPYELIQVDDDYSQLTIINNSKDILKLSIPSVYPFRPPSIWVPHKITNKRYDRWNADLTSEVSCSPFLAWVFTIIETPTYALRWSYVPFHLPLKCLCCESITCYNNWVASFTIVDILIEYLARKKFALYCSPLWYKRLLHIFNNERWNLPDDIIFNIVQQLNIPTRLKLY